MACEISASLNLTGASVRILAVALCCTIQATPSQAERNAVSDTARYLAGMRLPLNSSIRQLSYSDEWKAHSKEMSASWNNLENQQLSPARAFSRIEVAARENVVFYMFSGPDFTYAEVLFPKARIYVLSGLETIGELPDVSELSPDARSDLLARTRWSLQTFFKSVSFRTQEMYPGGRFVGTASVISILAERLGYTIRDLRQLDLRSDGSLDEEADKDRANAIRLTLANARGEIKSVYYFNVDLSNAGLQESGFLKFCERLGDADSLLKSTSYLPHRNEFSMLNSFLLARSATIVQDDSGIPIGQFGRAYWNITPFGNYRPPLGRFDKNYQPVLERLQRQKARRPLPFGMGYLWKIGGSNLQLIRNRQVRAVR
jgi:hypothetical protein